MSHRLISHSLDLKKLRDEGYVLEVKKAHLLVHDIPYVNSKKEVAFGSLVTPLGNVAGDRVGKPQDHTFYFAGDMPCDKDGNALKGILNSSQRKALADGVIVDHYFSAKPPGGNYKDYYEKVTTYVNTIAPHAQQINPDVKAKTFRLVKSDEPDSVFAYVDTNSSRAEIDLISDKLKDLKIAIVGLGGTGSYVLDFVAKTRVKEIHLFDEDTFFSHNAFRSPGAASFETLEKQLKKVEYLHGEYSKLHLHIVPHEYHLSSSNLDELLIMNFVFICIDEGESKKLIIEKLMEVNIPFVDTGVGISAIDGRLSGSVRTTTVTKEKTDHVSQRIPFADKGDGDYGTNIQIAEINALNAALAVIKWKKLFGFYADTGKEFNSYYTIDCNTLVNDENANP